MIRHSYHILQSQNVINENLNRKKLEIHVARYSTSFQTTHSETCILTFKIENINQPHMFRKTEDPQRVDDPRADAEWKANPGLREIVHGVEGTVNLPFISFPPFTFPFVFHFLLACFLRSDPKYLWGAQSDQADRSYKAAPKPDVEFDHVDTAHGEGSRGVKGWTGDEKGGLQHKPKRKDPIRRRNSLVWDV